MFLPAPREESFEALRSSLDGERVDFEEDHLLESKRGARPNTVSESAIDSAWEKFAVGTRNLVPSTLEGKVSGKWNKSDGRKGPKSGNDLSQTRLALFTRVDVVYAGSL